jgi:hypothetical protein
MNKKNNLATDIWRLMFFLAIAPVLQSSIIPILISRRTYPFIDVDLPAFGL